MLKRLDNKTVLGDGFRVCVPDIHTVVYSEDCRTAKIEIEGGMSGDLVNWDIYSETLSEWHVERGFEPMTAGDKEMILSRVSESLRILEMPHKVV